ncbi:hypothetical protein QBC35DRAFT_536275 [Podospora australis]|uniref:Uncharacterized protein n=1 Tax=Podospora australis TaxID=1536484 RepID=A0AAN7AD23_9PEZI|nr:hypothetical protein QBC35DRAFT_536275 [Podospora australis]
MLPIIARQKQLLLVSSRWRGSCLRGGYLPAPQHSYLNSSCSFFSVCCAGSSVGRAANFQSGPRHPPSRPQLHSVLLSPSRGLVPIPNSGSLRYLPSSKSYRSAFSTTASALLADGNGTPKDSDTFDVTLNSLVEKLNQEAEKHSMKAEVRRKKRERAEARSRDKQRREEERELLLLKKEQEQEQQSPPVKQQEDQEQQSSTPPRQPEPPNETIIEKLRKIANMGSQSSPQEKRRLQAEKKTSKAERKEPRKAAREQKKLESVTGMQTTKAGESTDPVALTEREQRKRERKQQKKLLRKEKKKLELEEELKTQKRMQAEEENEDEVMDDGIWTDEALPVRTKGASKADVPEKREEHLVENVKYKRGGILRSQPTLSDEAKEEHKLLRRKHLDVKMARAKSRRYGQSGYFRARSAADSVENRDDEGLVYEAYKLYYDALAAGEIINMDDLREKQEISKKDEISEEELEDEEEGLKLKIRKEMQEFDEQVKRHSRGLSSLRDVLTLIYSNEKALQDLGPKKKLGKRVLPASTTDTEAGIMAFDPQTSIEKVSQSMKTREMKFIDILFTTSSTQSSLPLTTIFTPPASCASSQWTYTSHISRTEPWREEFINSVVRTGANEDCQPSQTWAYSQSYSPGICFSGMSIASFSTTSEFGEGATTWGANCCQSFIRTPTVIPSVVTYDSTRTTLVSQIFPTTVSSLAIGHEPITVLWQESDLTAFPSQLSAQLRMTMDAYEAGEKLLTTKVETSVWREYSTRLYVSLLPVRTPSTTNTSTGNNGAPVVGLDPPGPKLPSGAIVGIVIGGIIALLVFGLGLWCIVRKRRQGGRTHNPEGSGLEPRSELYEGAPVPELGAGNRNIGDHSLTTEKKYGTAELGEGQVKGHELETGYAIHPMGHGSLARHQSASQNLRSTIHLLVGESIHPLALAPQLLHKLGHR